MEALPFDTTLENLTQSELSSTEKIKFFSDFPRVGLPLQLAFTGARDGMIRNARLSFSHATTMAK
jgi:hypothetical protein